MGYTFKQTLQEVTVYAPLEPGTRAKSLKVEITHNKINVLLANGSPVIQGELFSSVSVEDSVWSVEDQKELIITLGKKKQEWWPHVVTSDPKIDVTKMEPENSRLSDLDDDTRATVEKMMFDQQQKQKGLPSSDELKKKKMLENFMKQHPEMDFSQLKQENIR